MFQDILLIKEAILNALNLFFEELKETNHSKPLYKLCVDIIRFDTWTDIFKALLHAVFKEHGVLLIDAQNDKLRQLEKPLLKQIVTNHSKINQVFRQTQEQTIASGLTQMIQTDTNVHLFLHEDGMRQLISKEDNLFKLSKSDITYSEEELIELIETEPERFSNNVVTRPVMEEWLFNTVAFIGGPSEIKYWAELNNVFKLLNVEMPIVLPRMKMTYMMERTQKLLKQYSLNVEKVIQNGIDDDKNEFVREKASDTFIQQVEELKAKHENVYQQLLNEVKENQDNFNLVTKNEEIHNKQFDYLLKRYLLNIERENDISMRQFRELDLVLHPHHGLQERIWNPLQIMNDFGIDVFSPPLSHHLNIHLIKSLLNLNKSSFRPILSDDKIGFYIKKNFKIFYRISGG